MGQHDDSSCKSFPNQLTHSLETYSGSQFCCSGAWHPGSPLSGNISPHHLVWHQGTSADFGKRKAFSSPEVPAQTVLPPCVERTAARPALLLSSTNC